jgi:glutamate carboxypeptidase
MNLLPRSLYEAHLPELVSLLKDLVQIETPSQDRASLNHLVEYLVPRLQDLGGKVQVVTPTRAGDQIVCRWGSGPKGMLVLCHMDTVFDLGTVAQRPFRAAEDRLFGAGVLDMKCGIAILLTVLHTFREQGIWPEHAITALFTSDEETGSHASRRLIEDLARQSDIVFCLEPALSNGAVKTARKGTGVIYLEARGVAAHAGGDHEKGRNAIEELAHHILEAQRLTDYARGTTVNVGTVGGGTRGNVVPDEAHALVDFRVSAQAELERLQAWADQLSPVIDGARVSARLVLNRPPMPRDATMARSFARLKTIAG